MYIVIILVAAGWTPNLLVIEPYRASFPSDTKTVILCAQLCCVLMAVADLLWKHFPALLTLYLLTYIYLNV